LERGEPTAEEAAEGTEVVERVEEEGTRISESSAYMGGDILPGNMLLYGASV
jgi:hypothetical protein